jgi:acyl-CoA synthetase (AMP-forming)/AMP-acid ligase II
VIRAHAADQPNAPAIVGSHFAPVSYSDLQRQIEDVRTSLRASGFDQNARIAIAIANPAQATLAIVAISCSATAVPIDPKLTITEVDRCLQILRPDAVVALRDTASAARDVAKQRRVPIIEARVAQPGRLDLTFDFTKIGSALPSDEPDPQTPIFILHTSGTTADPNLVPFSHRNMLAVTERLQTWFGLTPQDRCLTVSPVYYSHALTTAVLPPCSPAAALRFPPTLRMSIRRNGSAT